MNIKWNKKDTYNFLKEYKEPKILFFDIEASNLDADFGKTICFGYKFKGQKYPNSISVLDDPNFLKNNKFNDFYVLKMCSEVFSKADVVCSWYGKRFDVPFLNTRLLFNKLPPLPPIIHIDGWEIARYGLKFHSNRLESVSSFLNIEEKTKLRPEIWSDAISGHKDSIKYIIEHCLQDVVVLEQAYEKIKPYSMRHPNLSILFSKRGSCRVCGSKKLTFQGYRYTLHSKYRRMKCTNCYSWQQNSIENKVW